MIRVIIVDDQVILRESLKFIVEQDDEIEVIGLAGDGNEALEMCGKLKPDVVLMDIMMPNCNGVEGTALIKNTYKDIKVLILTTFSDTENISSALKNGADGYVLKDIKPDELILAIKSVAQGLGVIHPNAFNTVVKQFDTPGIKVVNPLNSIDLGLSSKDIDIIRLIVGGKNNKEIATELFLSEGNIKNSVAAILDKLKLKDRTQLAVFAVKNNIV
ncbi:MAG: response regulator transcription factor [Clostridia bacterium]|nr:response regulator transcription factor [Clostridia bacterium]